MSDFIANNELIPDLRFLKLIQQCIDVGMSELKDTRKMDHIFEIPEQIKLCFEYLLVIASSGIIVASQIYEAPYIKEVNEMIKFLLRNVDGLVDFRNKDGWSMLEIAAGATELVSPDIVGYQDYQHYLDKDCIEWLLIFGAKWKGLKIDLLKETRTGIGEIIVKYNMLRKIAGLKFQTEALIDIKNLKEAKQFERRCLAEIKKMKTQRLFGNMTMYHFLRCSSKRSLVSAFKRNEVKKMYKQESYKTEYPIYKNLIEYNFIEGEKYVDIYEKAYEDLNKLCGKCLPNVVLDKIMECIDKKDMENLPKIWRHEHIHYNWDLKILSFEKQAMLI